jgi:hypothetical protein
MSSGEGENPIAIPRINPITINQFIGSYLLNSPVLVLSRGTQVIPTGGAATAIIWDEEILDTHNLWSPANPTRITFPAEWAGWYLVDCHAEFVANADGYRFMSLWDSEHGDEIVPCVNADLAAYPSFSILKDFGLFLEPINPEAYGSPFWYDPIMAVSQTSGDDLELDNAWIVVKWLSPYTPPPE